MKIGMAYKITHKGEYRGQSVSFNESTDALEYMKKHPEILILSFGPGRVGLKRETEGGQISAFCGH